MGVKGLHSLLSDDPRRFGVRWTLGADGANDGDNVSTIVYIDGPALLHHLLAAYPSLLVGRRDSASTMSMPPVGDNMPSCLFGQVSPEAVYVMAQSFVISLVAAGISEVHLVRDGLASEHKSEAQMSRLADACRRADLAARQLARWADDTAMALTNDSRSIGAWDVPHLFAEMALEEVFLDLMTAAGCDREDQNESSGPFFLHRAHGEAEGYICHLIEQRRIYREPEKMKCKEEIIILSNDTDMFVYNVPCFVPLHSLRFEQVTSTARCVITGWKYCRAKFLAAFPNLVPRFANNEGESFATMAAVSALAGNDYRLPQKYRTALSTARAQIIQSDIGGLRRRERNAPTAKGTVTAVIRFVGHFASRDKRLSAAVIATDASSSAENKSGWMRQLASAAAPDGKGKDVRECDLFEALCLVQKIYSDDATVDKESLMSWLPDINNTEIERLVHRSSFFCRVVIEAFGHSHRGANKTKKRRVVNTKRNQKAGKKRRKSDGDDDNEVECSSKSIWRASEFVRLRESLYDVLAHYLRNIAQNGCLSLTSVQECCRVGMEDFKATHTYIPSPPDCLTKGSRCRDMLDYCFAHDDRMLHEHAPSDNPLAIGILSRSLEELPNQLWPVFLTAMLLSTPNHVLLMFLVASAPKGLSFSSNDTHQSFGGDVRDVALKLQVAMYHSNLVVDGIMLFFPSDAADRDVVVRLETIRPSLFFRDAVLSALWGIIVAGKVESDVQCDIGEDDKLDAVLASIKRRLETVDGQVGLDEWISSVSLLWEHYLLCKCN
jgi:hypothetical protein